MPKGKKYQYKIKKETPKTVMGSQGKPANIKASHHKSRQTNSKDFYVK